MTEIRENKFDFLSHPEEDMYTDDDLKVKYKKEKGGEMTEIREKKVEEVTLLFKERLRELTSREREEVYEGVFDEFCRYCGDEDPRCQCRNDE